MRIDNVSILMLTIRKFFVKKNMKVCHFVFCMYIPNITFLQMDIIMNKRTKQNICKCFVMFLEAFAVVAFNNFLAYATCPTECVPHPYSCFMAYYSFPSSLFLLEATRRTNAFFRKVELACQCLRPRNRRTLSLWWASMRWCSWNGQEVCIFILFRCHLKMIRHLWMAPLNDVTPICTVVGTSAAIKIRTKRWGFWGRCFTFCKIH